MDLMDSNSPSGQSLPPFHPKTSTPPKGGSPALSATGIQNFLLSKIQTLRLRSDTSQRIQVSPAGFSTEPLGWVLEPHGQVLVQRRRVLGSTAGALPI